MINSANTQIVLVVDDAPASLGMLSETLERCGFTVLLAPDGEKALDVVEHVSPSAILMDAMLPGLNGFETTRILKSRPELSDVPIVFMTGLGETEDIVSGFEAGAVDYLTKPLNLTELVARLRTHLVNAHDSSASRTALELSGQALISAESNGKCTWVTDRAEHYFTTNENYLPAEAIEWLKQLDGAEYSGADLNINVSGRSVTLQFLGPGTNGEYLIRIKEAINDNWNKLLADNFGLTEREADVLTWILNGKQNKEIAAILDISPRTVNKHLEHIYIKLGVENRTAAAMLATRRIVELTHH